MVRVIRRFVSGIGQDSARESSVLWVMQQELALAFLPDDDGGE